MDSMHVDRSIVEYTSTNPQGKVLATIPVSISEMETKILELVGDRYPTLTLPDREGGGTGYIDFVTPGDMSSPVMVGTDKWGRPFVAVRVERVGKVTVQVIFRRYREGGVWVTGGSGPFMSGAFDGERLEKLARLLKGEQVGRTDYSKSLECPKTAHHVRPAPECASPEMVCYEVGEYHLV